MELQAFSAKKEADLLAAKEKLERLWPSSGGKCSSREWLVPTQGLLVAYASGEFQPAASTSTTEQRAQQ